MSYQVLARKWRPHHFENIVGQEHIIRMLTNALTQKRLHHAYLFTGTRGVGKTTLARILAKCLNCETGVKATPCDACFACHAIDQGKFLDLLEIDAASRTKVEDTRELLDNVLYPPTQGRYKVYLIDEVHMLSNHSFNALLKTLEEPPEHVKFLLATTDPKRLPITILSRCLQFHLKRITPQKITQHLQHICATENIPSDQAALEKLAFAADGSMRDALSLLDQGIAYGEGAVNKADVYTMLGSMAQDDLFPLLSALIAKDGKLLLAAIHSLAENAPDFQQLLEEFINLLHKIALAQIIPSTRELEIISDFAQRLTPDEVQLYYQIALLSRRDLSLSPSPQQGFEMSMLRMLAFKLEATPLDKANPMAISPPVSTEANNKQDNRQNNRQAAPLAQPKENPEVPEAPEAPEALIHGEEWREILPKLELSGMTFALASNCILKKMTENKIELLISVNHRPMLNPKLKERIQEALVRYFKKPMQLDISVTNTEITTPQKLKQEEKKQLLENAKEIMLNDPQVKKIMEAYDASLEVSLVND